MSRYIDAIPFAQAVSDLRNKEREEYDNLVGKHRSLARSIHGQHVEFCEKMLKTIREQPTVDAVPAVRCRECYYKDEKRIMDEDALWCRKHHMYVTADFYCADGERKDE